MPVIKILIPQSNLLTVDDFKEFQKNYGLSNFCLQQLCESNAEGYNGTTITISVITTCKPSVCKEDQFLDHKEKGISEKRIIKKDNIKKPFTL